MLTERTLSDFPDKKLVCGSGMAGFESSNKIVTKKNNEKSVYLRRR